MRPIAMSIAGLDPSGGAGILADIKTFEQIQTLGFGVCTSITYQRDDLMAGVQWLSTSDILQQADVLLEKFDVKYCKIGLVENFDTLQAIIHYLHQKNIKIILDPILKASSGFDFHNDTHALIPLLQKVYLLTPNYLEMQQIFQTEKKTGINKEILKETHIFLKGGHHTEQLGTDYLLGQDFEIPFPPQEGNYSEKHGSGCILSAAITAYLAQGESLATACQKAKDYTAKALSSNPSLLAYHS